MTAPSVAIVTMDPREPLPELHSVVLLRHFDEIDPRGTVIEIVVRDALAQEDVTRPVRPDGALMSWEEALTAAQARALDEGLTRVLVIDRTAGQRAREILSAAGHHSAGPTDVDSDPEDGEQGPDMRDVRRS
jgi:hypothetical protein